jgi:hypothetical protein
VIGGVDALIGITHTTMSATSLVMSFSAGAIG